MSGINSALIGVCQATRTEICLFIGQRRFRALFDQAISITLSWDLRTVNGGVKTCHWGGAKAGQFGVRALERVALK